MKYLTKKSIIKLLENEQARVIDSLQKGIYEFIDESLELALNKPHIQRLVQDLHDHLYMADKTAKALVVALNGEPTNNHYRTVLSLSGHYYNPTEFKKTIKHSFGVYGLNDSYPKDIEVLACADPVSYAKVMELKAYAQEVETNYNVLICNVKSFSKAKDCVTYLVSLGYDENMFSDESENITALTVPLATDFLIGMNSAKEEQMVI